MAQKTEYSLLKRVFSAIFFGVGGAAGSRVFIALANVLLSRILGQEVFGEFASVNTTVNLFVTLSGIGISATVTRYIALNRGDKVLQGMYIRTLSRLCLAMTALLSAAMYLCAPQVSLLSTGGLALTGYFRIVALAVFFTGMSAVEQSVMLGFERFGASSVAQLVRCALFCVLGYCFSRRWGIYGAVYALVISHGVQYAISRFYNLYYLKKNAVPLQWCWNGATKQALLTFALPAFASTLLVLPVNWLGNAILTRTAGFSQVAVFSIAHQWMSYITYIPSQMGHMRPIYTDLFTNCRRKSLRNLIMRTIFVTSVVAAFIGAVVVAFSEPILGIYGAGYKDGQYTLAFMVLAAVFYTAQVQTGFLLQATGRMWQSLCINLVWGIILLSSYSMLLSYEARGYAIAYSIAYGVTLLLQLVISARILKSLPQEPEDA